MNVAICDDEVKDRTLLRDFLEIYCRSLRVPIQTVEYASGEEMLLDFVPGKFQLIFLDIYLKTLNGVTLAKRLRETDRECTVIFITNSSQHPLEAFRVQAFDYLVKPISFEQISATLDRCQRLFKPEMEYIEITTGRLNHSILLRDIYWADIHTKVSRIHLRKKTMYINTPFATLSRLLNGAPFLLCNRACIVNMDHITQILERDFLLDNGETVPIRQRNGTIVKQSFIDYTWGKIRGGIL